MRKIISVICILSIAARCLADSHTIRGYVHDHQSQETLIGATIYETGSSMGTITNEYGFYSITLPDGNVTINTGYVGYTPRSISFFLSADTLLNIELSEVSELSEVTITGNRLDLGVQGAQMSAVDLPIEQIKAVPALFGESDVLKALQLLPGVQGGTEGTAGLFVRGGNPDENLLLIDGVPVYNVNHMFGLFSTFNPDAIKNVTLYKGSFPAHYCGRLSSIVDVRMKDGDMHNYHGNASIGLISSKINLEGPIADGKTSFNVSLRRTYSDLILNSAIFLAEKLNREIDENTSMGYYFYDLNVKLNHRFNDRDRLYASWYSGDDDVYFTYKTRDSYLSKDKAKLGWRWGNTIAAVRWNHVIGPRLFMDLSANYTQYRHRMNLGISSEDKQYKEIMSEKLTMKSGIFDETLRADFHYSPTPQHDIRFGGYATHHMFRPDVTSLKENYSDQDTTYTNGLKIGQKQINAMELQSYFEDNLTITDYLKADLGLSYSLFHVNGHTYNSLEPRISSRLLITDNLSFKAGYAYMTQYIHLLSNNSISLPTDLWVPVTDKIKPEHSHQFASGIFYEIKNVADLSLEGYYKTETNLLEYKEGASYLSTGTDWQDKVAMGRGWSYGLEFMAQRSFGRFNGWVSYTWSHTQRQFDRPGMVLNGGKAFNAKYDRRHDFSITGSYRFNDHFDMSATWIYATGNCGSLYTQYYDSHKESYYSTPQIGYFTERNNFRLNPYHRLDLGMNWHKPIQFFNRDADRTLNLSIYNAYNNKNPFLVYTYEDSYWDSSTNSALYYRRLRQLTLFPILPTISYTISF